MPVAEIKYKSGGKGYGFKAVSAERGQLRRLWSLQWGSNPQPTGCECGLGVIIYKSRGKEGGVPWEGEHAVSRMRAVCVSLRMDVQTIQPCCSAGNPWASWPHFTARVTIGVWDGPKHQCSTKHRLPWWHTFREGVYALC